MDVLSRNLDGAGSLRTVAPSVVIRRWSGRADKQSAAELGKATGARYVVFGGLGGRRYRACQCAGARPAHRADRRRGEPPRPAYARGPARGSVTFSLVSTLAPNAQGTARLSSIGTASLPALKAFLQAEQFYRQSSWDSSSAAYARAIASDSTFALAIHGLGQTYGWCAWRRRISGGRELPACGASQPRTLHARQSRARGRFDSSRRSRVVQEHVADIPECGGGFSAPSSRRCSAIRTTRSCCIPSGTRAITGGGGSRSAFRPEKVIGDVRPRDRGGLRRSPRPTSMPSSWRSDWAAPERGANTCPPVPRAHADGHGGERHAAGGPPQRSIGGQFRRDRTDARHRLERRVGPRDERDVELGGHGGDRASPPATDQAVAPFELPPSRDTARANRRIGERLMDRGHANASLANGPGAALAAGRDRAARRL